MIILILLLFYCIQCEERGVYMATHSFKPPYLYGMSSQIPFWEYGGSTVATEQYIRLVPAVQSRVGWIWNQRIVMDFTIHNTRSPGADGLALWITKDRNQEGKLWGGPSAFNGIGFIFDTYDNNHNGDNPAIILIKNDGNSNIPWDIDNDLLNNQVARCVSHFRNPINEKNSVKIVYENTKLSVYIDTLGKGEYSDCFSVDNFIVPRGCYLGITAATGGLADYHDVYGIYVRDLDAVKGESYEERREESNRGRRKGWYDPYKDTIKDKIKIHRQKQLEDEMLNRGVALDEEEHNTKYGIRNDEQETVSDLTRRLREAKEREENKMKVEEERAKEEIRIKEKKVNNEDETNFFDDLKVKLKSMVINEEVEEEKNIKTEKEDTSISGDTAIILIEALEEVVNTIKHSSTKGDITQIIRRVEKISDSQQSIGQMMIDVNKDVKSQVELLAEKINEQVSLLQEEVKRLNNVINNLGGTVTDMKSRQRSFEREITDSTKGISNTLKKTSSWGFGMYFIIFELLFIVAIYFYKKFRDEKKKKLL